jgi:hypothetical protein
VNGAEPQDIGAEGTLQGGEGDHVRIVAQDAGERCMSGA